MSSRASRPRSRRRMVGVSAVAVGALLSTYAGAMRTSSYVRAEPINALAGCSAGATEVATDDSLQEAVTNSVDGAVICITADITVSQTLILDDTSVTIEGDSATVELSGGGATRILYADFTGGLDDTLILRNLTFTQGTSLNADDSDGGAVLVRGINEVDTFIGEDITVKESYSFEDGGGIALQQMDYVRLSRARFYDDSAASDSGAFEINYANSVVIDNSIFKRNRAVVDQGGAFEFQDVVDVRVSYSTFSDNESGDDGGSIQIFSGSDYVRLSNSSFTDDSAGDDGGSIAFEDITTLRIDRLTVDGGQAADVGGAVFLYDDTDVEITNSTFTSNTSLNSGGAVFVSTPNGPISFTDVTAYDNRSSTGSGGFLRVAGATSETSLDGVTSRRNYAAADGGSIKQTAGSLTVQDSTFQDDSSSDGGAMFLTGLSVATITNSDFVGNEAVDDAGAVRVIDSGSAYISSSVFRQNQVATDDGGGILINNVDDTISITSVTLDRNSTGGEGGGAKIVNSDGYVLLSDLTVSGNVAGLDGGGIYINDPRELVIKDSAFSSNYSGSDGGALYIDNNDGTADTQTLTNLTFADDSAAIDGGAIHAWMEGPLTLSGVTATNNTAGDDGGFAYLLSDDTYVLSSNFLIEDATLTGHRALGPSNGDGGALRIREAYSITLRDVSIADSYAADDGGGALISNIVDVSVESSSFVNNSAGDFSGGLDITNVYSSASIEGTTLAGNTSTQDGGGFYTYLKDGASLSFMNSTLFNNSTASRGSDVGGAMLLIGGIGTTASLDFVTVTGNSADRGGGIFVDQNIVTSISNSIVAGNSSAVSGADLWLDGTASLDDSFSLFTSAAAITGATADGPGTLFGAPKLNGLADNGGPTLTMLPQWDSPAFQAGDPNWTAPPANDQRGAGFLRDAGGRVSMGAIQGRSAKPIPPAVPASAPRDVEAAPGDGQVLVSWTTPASTGTFPITAYQVDDSTGTYSCLVEVAPDEPLSCVIDDLTNGEPYAFRVRALTGAGWGAWSDFTDDVVPQPGPSMIITGTRESRSVSVEGVTTGLVGETVIPRLRFPGQPAYQDGLSRPVVDEAGDFTWQRKTRKKVYVYFFSEDREVRSNRVIIRTRG